MKKTTVTGIAAALGLAVLAAPALAGDTLSRGRLELSTSASFNSIQEGDGGESLSALNLPTRLGYFVTDRLALEGELGFTHISGDGEGQTGALFSGNVLYHFGQASVRPFLLAGAGIGNGFDYFGLVVDTDSTVKTFNAGAGLKALMGERAALRLEYRFTRASGSGENFGDFSTPDEHVNNHRVLVGVSLFFR